jgi:hypothetical protein
MKPKAIRDILIIKEFKSNETFGAYREAEQFIKDSGFDCGSMSYPYPTAITKKPYSETTLPWKWKNFSKQDKLSVDGTITGDFRSGTVTVTIFK